MLLMAGPMPNTQSIIKAPQSGLFTPVQEHPAHLLGNVTPFYRTTAGAAYLGDSSDLMKAMPNNSVNLVFTSPPYALHFKKEYGNVSKEDYVEWFLPFARQVHRILTEDGAV